MEKNENKYTAIKVKGIKHWIWFEVKNTELFDDKFIGTKGWGINGVQTEMDVNVDLIEGQIFSEVLQYG